MMILELSQFLSNPKVVEQQDLKGLGVRIQSKYKDYFGCSGTCNTTKTQVEQQGCAYAVCMAMHAEWFSARQGDWRRRAHTYKGHAVQCQATRRTWHVCMHDRQMVRHSNSMCSYAYRMRLCHAASSAMTWFLGYFFKILDIFHGQRIY